MKNKIQNTLKDNIYDSLRAVLDHLDMPDVPVVFSHSSGLEHKKTYCVVQILDRKRVGRVQETVGSPIDQDSLNYYTNYYTLYLQVSFVGKDSDDVMAEFEDSVFSSRACLQFFQKRSLGAIKQSKSRLVPLLRETEWINAHNIDIDLSYAVQSHEDIDWIDSFKIKDAYGFDPWQIP